MIGAKFMGKAHTNAYRQATYFVWRMDEEVAGSGVTGDLLAHVVDLSNFPAGDIESVAAASDRWVPVEKAWKEPL